MKQRRSAPLLRVAVGCLLLSTASLHAENPKPGMPGQRPVMPRPMKLNNEGMKPGQMPDRHPGLPGFGPGPHQKPGDVGKQRGEAMEARPGMGRYRGLDASAPPGFPRMGAAGVRHHRPRPQLTPEQLAKRKEHVAKLRANYGNEVLQRREGKMELGIHAWRIARLERIKTLALEQQKPKLVEKVEALIKKENERHQQRMDRLRTGQPLGDAGGAPAPAQPKAVENKTGGQP